MDEFPYCYSLEQELLEDYPDDSQRAEVEAIIYGMCCDEDDE